MWITNQEFKDIYLHPLYLIYKEKESKYLHYKWKNKEAIKLQYENAKELFYNKIREYEDIKKINDKFKQEKLLNY